MEKAYHMGVLRGKQDVSYEQFYLLLSKRMVVEELFSL